MLRPQEFQTKMSENIRQQAHSSLMSILNPMHVLHRSLQNIEREDFERDPSCRNPNSPAAPSEIHSAGSIRERTGPEYESESFSQKAPNCMSIDYNVTGSGRCAPPRNNDHRLEPARNVLFPIQANTTPESAVRKSPRPGRRGTMKCARCRRHKRGMRAPCVTPQDDPLGPCIPCRKGGLGDTCGERTYPSGSLSSSRRNVSELVGQVSNVLNGARQRAAARYRDQVAPNSPLLKRSAEIEEPEKYGLSAAKSLQRKAESVHRVNDPGESHQKLPLRRHRCCEDVVPTLHHHESSLNEGRLKVDHESIKSSYRVPRSQDGMKAAIELHNITTNFWGVLTTCFPSTDRTIIESVVNALLITLKNSTEEDDTLFHLKQEIPLSMEEMKIRIEDATNNCPRRSLSPRSIPNDCREQERPYPTVLIKRKNSSGVIIES